MNLLFEDGSIRGDVRPLLFAELGMSEVPRASLADVATKAEDTALADMELRYRDELEQVRFAAEDATRRECEAQRLREVSAERSAIGAMCEAFASAKQAYFAEVEREVVGLSLAVAARILQREAAADPLLLQGVVRVALSRLGDPEDAVLSVPVEALPRWQQAMADVTSLRVDSDKAMCGGDCRLQAPAGLAELGIAAQLVEVERGFCDLLARRPA